MGFGRFASVGFALMWFCGGCCRVLLGGGAVFMVLC